MSGISIQTTARVIPMVYAYSTPEIDRHNGWVKIGYTDRQSVDERIAQQTHTSDVRVKKEWQGNATFEDGTGDTFRDSDFHAYLRKQGILQPQDEGNEFFDPESHQGFVKMLEVTAHSSFADDPRSIILAPDEQKRQIADRLRKLTGASIGQIKRFLHME